MQTQLTFYQQRTQTKLSELLSKAMLEPAIPDKIKQAMRYATLNNGKRLRPALIYAVGQSLDIPLEQLDSSACAIELIHSYSLVHDDLPAMDDDDLRRGVPTCHIQFDEATAILVGDAQQTLAFKALSDDALTQPEHKVELIRLLADASGIAGMIGGQMIDIQSENLELGLDSLKTMHLMKTGALIRTSLLMGAVQSSRYTEIKSSLKQLGDCIGLAFQVQDDILDIEGDTQTLGKPQGSDQEANKSTYPRLLGLDKSKQYRDQLIQQAQSHLSESGIKSLFLENLITYIAQRDH